MKATIEVTARQAYAIREAILVAKRERGHIDSVNYGRVEWRDIVAELTDTLYKAERAAWHRPSYGEIVQWYWSSSGIGRMPTDAEVELLRVNGIPT